MKLSLKQEALIPIFTKKWLNIAFSEKSIDREQAKKIINAVYQLLGYREPEILFFENIESIAKNIQPYRIKNQWNRIVSNPGKMERSS